MQAILLGWDPELNLAIPISIDRFELTLTVMVHEDLGRFLTLFCPDLAILFLLVAANRRSVGILGVASVYSKALVCAPLEEVLWSLVVL